MVNALTGTEETVPLFQAIFGGTGTALIRNTQTEVLSVLSEDGTISEAGGGFHYGMWVQSHQPDQKIEIHSMEDAIAPVQLHKNRSDTAQFVMLFMDENLNEEIRKKSGDIAEAGLENPQIFDWIAERFISTPSVVAVAAEKVLSVAQISGHKKLEELLELFIKNQE